MLRYFASWLLLLVAGPALAQRLVVQTASLASGQAVGLDLKYAHTIRVRPGGDEQLRVQAKVSLNDNQQNDLYSLELERRSDGVDVVEKLDENRLRQTHFTGNCDGGSMNNSSDAVNLPRPGNRPARSGDYRYNYCIRIDYEVTLPARAGLRIKTLTGDLDLSDLQGYITVNTVSGDIVLSKVSGAVSVRSVSGDVKLGTYGGQELDARSVSGDVSMSWPTAQAADLRLQSVSGEVYADPAVTFTNLRSGSRVGYELRGTYGTGTGALLRLESVSGDVFFRRE